MVFSRELPGIIGLFVGFSTLKEYGVEKVFVLENGNTDSSQRNIIYIVNDEDPATVQAVAGKLAIIVVSSDLERIMCGRCDDSSQSASLPL